MSPVAVVVLTMVAAITGGVVGDLSRDRAECANELVGLATCLSYVGEGGSSSRSPTPDCCNGLGQVLGKSPKCLCVLIKDRDDPGLGIKINVTRALSLPSTCHVPANITHCPQLLGLPLNSKDAAIFLGASANAGEAPAASVNGSSPSGSITTPQKNDGGGRSYNYPTRWKTALGAFFIFFIVGFNNKN